MDAASNNDVVRRIYEDLVNGQRLDLLEDYFSPEYVNHKMPGGRVATKQLFVALFDAFPDAQVSIDSVCEAGDRVWVRITMRGTHLGTFMGMPGTGRTFAATTINELRLEDSKVVEEWGVTDTLGMMQQLGLLPEATS
jgi:predicted ester cyclase